MLACVAALVWPTEPATLCGVACGESVCWRDVLTERWDGRADEEREETTDYGHGVYLSTMRYVFSF